MKNPIILSVLLMCLFSFNTHAQNNLSWRKNVKLGDALYAKAQYVDAGEHYRAAWRQKTNKKELIYKAGECFYNIRDYRNAADCWKNVKDANASYPLIGLRYSRCLKQSGDYEAASSELVNFLGHYQGADKALVSQIVQNELRGCELAAQLAVKGGDQNVIVEHLSSNINTQETEFAPFPFGEEALYFSSTMGKRAEIYRSIQSGGEWGKAIPIENFPTIDKDHFCNGTLSPDASRFYFTICKSQENWGGQTSKCEIYVTRRVNKTWTSPERLPDYINEATSTSTHPYVLHDGAIEILYFSSNRNGGSGGMDIWYTTRELTSKANDFTLPINVGSKINTIGDEITPYYDLLEGKLYFSSNGQISIGGFDIFSTKGARSNWEKPVNLGTPLCSPADDFFFIKTSSGKGGFLVSNRTFNLQKVTTTHEDIFSFSYKMPTRQWVASGEVLDKSTGESLPNVQVAIYEITNTGLKRFISKVTTENGKYNFVVEPSMKYYLEASKDSFFPTAYEFDTYDFATYDDFGAALYLEPFEQIGGSGDEVAVKEKPDPNMPKPVVNNPAVAPVEKPLSSKEETKPVNKDNAKPPTNSNTPRQAGTYYKIQIIALYQFDPNHSRYAGIKDLARIESEFIPDKKLYRVLLADYDSPEAAQAHLAKVKTIKDFNGAFLVEYRDGQRVGIVR